MPTSRATARSVARQPALAPAFIFIHSALWARFPLHKYLLNPFEPIPLGR
jgi:hypothetical protein